MDIIWVVVAFVVGAFFLLILQFGYSERARRQRWMEQYKRDWGSVPDRQYDEAELDKISRYFYYNLKKGKVRGQQTGG